jgi:hypothetical protein
MVFGCIFQLQINSLSTGDPLLIILVGMVPEDATEMRSDDEVVSQHEKAGKFIVYLMARGGVGDLDSVDKKKHIPCFMLDSKKVEWKDASCAVALKPSFRVSGPIEWTIDDIASLKSDSILGYTSEEFNASLKDDAFKWWKIGTSTIHRTLKTSAECKEFASQRDRSQVGTRSQ